MAPRACSSCSRGAVQGELGRGGWITRLARINDELERQAAIKEAMTEALYQGKPLFKGMPIKLVREQSPPSGSGCSPSKPEPDPGDAEPWEEPISDLAAVLDELVDGVGQYIAAASANLETAALWCGDDPRVRSAALHAEAGAAEPDQAVRQDHLPGLPVRTSSAVRSSTSGVTESSFIRISDAWQPTWLMDEADRYLNPATAGEALTAAINASSYRRLARKKVCVPNADGGWDMHDFEFWCPMIMAGIRTLVDTVQDRSIVLVMQRAKPGELKHRLIDGTSPVFEEIARKLARWAKDLSELDLDPEVPAFLHNREADLWRPLFAIAALAGRSWPERVLQAAETIHGQRAEDEARLTLLLEAIREEFGASERMFTADLVARLIAREGEPWATIKRNGGPIDAYYLRGMLKGVIERDPTSAERKRGGTATAASTPGPISRRPGRDIYPRDPVNDPAHPAIRHQRPQTRSAEPDSVAPDQNEASGAIRASARRASGWRPDGSDGGNSSGAKQASDKATENRRGAGWAGCAGSNRARREHISRRRQRRRPAGCFRCATAASSSPTRACRGDRCRRSTSRPASPSILSGEQPA